MPCPTCASARTNIRKLQELPENDGWEGPAMWERCTDAWHGDCPRNLLWAKELREQNNAVRSADSLLDFYYCVVCPRKREKK